MIKKVRWLIGIAAAANSLFFGTWLLFVIFGLNSPTQLAGYEISFVQFFRVLAEITVGSLLIAALAFL